MRSAFTRPHWLTDRALAQWRFHARRGPIRRAVKAAEQGHADTNPERTRERASAALTALVGSLPVICALPPGAEAESVRRAICNHAAGIFGNSYDDNDDIVLMHDGLVYAASVRDDIIALRAHARTLVPRRTMRAA